MSHSRFRQLASITSAAVLAVMVLGAGAVEASPPGWVASPIVKVPPTVGAGANAGYSFSIANNGSSNISALYLLATDVTEDAVYAHWWISTTSSGAPVRNDSCPLTGPLKCTLGALNAGQTASFVIAFSVGTTDFSVTFQANTTGSIQSPNGHNHGDVLQWQATTSVSNSKNFAGGFQVTGQDIGTDPGIGRTNTQSTKVHPPTTTNLAPVTVEDGITTFPGTGTNPCHGSTKCYGDWANVNVDNGNVGPVEVTITIYAGSISGNPDPLSIGLWHDGTVIMTRCSASTLPTAGGAECVTVTKDSSGNYVIVAWLNHNGTLRGLS